MLPQLRRRKRKAKSCKNKNLMSKESKRQSSMSPAYKTLKKSWWLPSKHYKQSPIASSIGLDIGIAPIYVITGITTYSGSLAFYNSYHPSEHFAIVFSPRFIHYSTATWTLGNNSHYHYPLYGYSTGIIVGKKHQFSFEISQFTTIEDTYSFALPPIIGFGYIWNIGK